MQYHHGMLKTVMAIFIPETYVIYVCTRDKLHAYCTLFYLGHHGVLPTGCLNVHNNVCD